MADNDDKKVKDLLDASTRAELERWFGLPSFQQLAEQDIPAAPPPEDPAVAAREARRAAAIAAVDPVVLEAVFGPRRALVKPRPPFDVHVDPSITCIDMKQLDRLRSMAEPRELELPPDLNDDLKDRTPQALLRDLHRPELNFPKVFEVVDMAAEQRFDIVAAVAEAMATSWRLPPLTGSPYHEARALLHASRAERRQPWTEIKMPNRRVTE